MTILLEEVEVECLMSAHLPQYICNCFKASGFDSLGVIADMNISKECGASDSIKLIEDFINTNFSGNSSYSYSHGSHVSHTSWT